MTASVRRQKTLVTMTNPVHLLLLVMMAMMATMMVMTTTKPLMHQRLQLQQ